MFPFPISRAECRAGRWPGWETRPESKSIPPAHTTWDVGRVNVLGEEDGLSYGASEGAGCCTYTHARTHTCTHTGTHACMHACRQAGTHDTHALAFLIDSEGKLSVMLQYVCARVRFNLGDTVARIHTAHPFHHFPFFREAFHAISHSIAAGLNRGN